jgi:putative ABC transport system permease protein
VPGRLDRLRLHLALAMVGALRFIVPRRQRAVWLAEWRGELRYLSSSSSFGSPLQRPDVLAHSLHAIPHAAAHRRHEWSPEMLLQDLRYGARRLLRAPGFTAVAMLTIAIGVGANTAIFSVIDSTLINPLPYPDAHRLVYLWKQAPGMNLQTTPDAEDVRLWRDNAASFEEIQVYQSSTKTLTGGAEPRRLIGLHVLPGFFEFLGAEPLLGRGFSDDEARLDERVVIISHGLWQSQFGGNEGVLGSTAVLDDEPHTVIGVMARGFRFQAPFEDTQFWLPLSMQGAADALSPFAIARLAEGVGPEAADAELEALAAARAEETGEDVWPGRARRAQDLHGDRFSTSLFMLQAAVAMVLLIACANVANLLLARGVGQGNEMALRAAIGAPRGRLVRQMLTEHLLLAAGGGLAGYGLARGAVAAIVALRPEQMTSLATVRIDGWVFFFAMGIAALTGLLFGAGPALQVSRQDLAGQIKDAARASSPSRGHGWLRGALVVGEVALALLLLVGAGLLLGSLTRLIHVDLGFDTDNVVMVGVDLPESRYPEAAQRGAFRDDLEARIRQVAGDRLEGIAAAGGPLPTLGLWFGNFAPEGEEPVDPFTNAATHTGQISPGYLTTLGASFVAGRDFVPADVDDPDNPVIVNANWARLMWGDETTVGRRIEVPGRESASLFRVVGVIEDAMLQGPTGSFGELQIFRPGANFSYLALIVRTEGDPAPLLGALKEQVWAIDADLPIDQIAVLSDVYADRLAAERFNVVLLGAFAAIAVVLALIGVYGVLSYAVGQRTREIGIRMALGAHRGNVVPMVAWHGMRMVLLGVLLGIAGAVALTRFIESLLFEVSTVDPVIYLVVAGAVVAVAALACLMPALRAARLDATEALRA